MKRLSTIFLLLASIFIVNSDLFACSNVIVTRGASKDGSVMVTYSADSHQLYGEVYYRPAQSFPKGTMMDIYEWDTGKYMGKIPQVSKTYQTVGNMNEHQLIITETTFGGLQQLPNPDGIMDYGSLIWVTLQRAKTAREAIKIMDELTQTYGYASGGESFSIADKNEAWIMEMVGKGEEKGTVWVAIRIPDGYISAHANQSRIDKFDMNDPENCLYSKDVISFARKAGLFEGEDSEFSFCDTYCPADFSGLRGCEARVWAAFNILGKGRFDWEDASGSHSRAANEYLDFAMGRNAANKMPLYIKPAQKVDVHEVANVMRDHYENTPMDMTTDIGAGPHALPYRWRPMSFEYEGKRYTHERAIATQQTGYWMLGQARNWLDDTVGGILWFGVDDAATSCLSPIYTNTTEIPECFREGNGSMMKYSPTSAFWLFNRVTHFAYLMYDRVAPVLQDAAKKHETTCMKEVTEIDKEAQKLVKAGKEKKAIKLLTEYTVNTAQKMFNDWQELENFVLVKFMDGNVKHQNEDGSFKDNGHDKDIPASPGHPPYPEKWLKAIVEDNGETLRIN